MNTTKFILSWDIATDMSDPFIGATDGLDSCDLKVAVSQMSVIEIDIE